MKNKSKVTPSQESIIMWEAEDNLHLKACCEYLPSKHKFKVTVSYGSKKYFELFRANYEPRFGMDITDHNESIKISEELAKKIEIEENLK